MKEVPKSECDPDMLDEYDFCAGVRGKYAGRYAEGSKVVVIEPDLAQIFPDAASVNHALRDWPEHMEEMKALARRWALTTT